MTQLISIISVATGLLWSEYVIFYIFGFGILCTIYLKAPQIVYFKDMFSLFTVDPESIENSKANKDIYKISPLRSFFTSLSSMLGTGNIAGVCAGIAVGGPGAVFWMWIMAIFGAANAFVECSLSQLYKEVYKGEFRAGTPYFIEKIFTRLISKKIAVYLAVFFAVLIVLTTPGIILSIQSYYIADSLEYSMNIDRIFSVVIVAILTAIVISGGIKNISAFSQYIVPLMGGMYLFLTFVVIIMHPYKSVESIYLIFNSALNTDSMFGGLLYAAISNGVRRGIFSNEAGSGTVSSISGVAHSNHPASQGLIQVLAVYFDTLLICTSTALVILILDSYNVFLDDNIIFQGVPLEVSRGVQYIQYGVSQSFGYIGSLYVSIIFSCFAFTTILSSYYIGELSLAYISRALNINNFKLLTNLMRLMALIFIILGGFIDIDTVWELTDLGMGICTIISLTILIFGLPLSSKIISDYGKKRRLGILPNMIKFKSSDIQVHDTEYWK